MAEGTKPRVIIDNKKQDTIEVCCGEDCIEVAVGADSNGTAAEPDRKEKPITLTPVGPGGSFLHFLILSVEGIDHLLAEAERLRDGWQPPVQGRSDITGHIIFRVRNVSKIDIRQLSAVYELSWKTECPVILQVLD